MNEFLSLSPHWEPTEYGPEEIRQTSGSLCIAIKNQIVSRVYDDRAKSVRDTIRVSSYPLAVWLASSWWRLCREPTPEKPDTNWRLSHEMHGSGHGFLWPPLRFESDGETVTLLCTPSVAESSEPIRYLTFCRESVPIGVFTKAIESFIQTVLARLEIVGIQNTQLHTLWREVTLERSDSRTTAYRTLEALLGFDPDDAPESIISDLFHLSNDVGVAAVAEIAATRIGRDLSLILENIDQSIHCSGVSGNLASVPKIDINRPDQQDHPPWKRGWSLARATRATLGIKTMAPLSDQDLGDILGMTKQDLTEGVSPLNGMPWSLAIREADGHQIYFLFRGKRREGRRFEAARWLVDLLSAPACDRWLPVTGTKMARQKIQRSFAAELLAPIEGLKEFLGDNLTDEERVIDAGIHFGVSPLTIRSQLSNHGLIRPESVGIY
ncbi:MAG: hypothetical protein HQL94_05590 [Magnetococcales bacterium]|nr:hypothetical protein [Magnetococcales bacterium]MBF0438320.1 hypothetical protein [Magnetococcales bacterium]